ncbi:hypothetical protein NIES21_59660 (plasmid) [Anabaenopsis circularis NIES-21]|uniref:Uncharacterized protein n=1 Tax=Anabaenopsis circularis NIES-21 TaxID=1085406 RepID=A0A1Z4GS13_9CYAN|nr:hypothetical protein NIES21_59660 [Anabaenopsis circularis NIES-21]
MITQSKFENGITLLQTHFNRKLCEAAIAVWSEYLNEHLDDDTFTLAVKEAVLSLDFFPSAKKLVEFATTSKEVQAITDWQTICSAAKTSSEQWQQEILQPLCERAHIALSAIGGLQAIALAEDWQLNKLEKQFHTVYQKSPNGVKFLPPPRPQPTAVETVEPERPTANINLETKTPAIRQIIEKLNLRSLGYDVPIEEVYATAFARCGWEIDENRLNYFMRLEDKQEILTKVQFAMKHKSNWRSAQFIFDEITGYKVPRPEFDSKAIAQQWLKEPEHVLEYSQD